MICYNKYCAVVAGYQISYANNYLEIQLIRNMKLIVHRLLNLL